MAFFNREKNKKSAIIDRIKFDGPNDGSPWLVYKYDSESFVLGSQLIVNQGQEALFFKGGKALDLFGPGTHTLQTGNLPLLNKLVNLPFGGDTPFTAEIYYLNKTSKLNMNWGTQNPFAVEDPKYGIILSIRSHGTYGLRINDTRQFIAGLVGAVPNGSIVFHEFVLSYFSGLITSKVKNIVAAYMIKQQRSFLEITAYLDDISKECQNALADEFERFGAELVNFYVEAISPPKNEYEKLKNMKEELAMGNEFYKERRTFDVMETLAQNDAGSLANAGAGLGIGLGMAGAAGTMFSDIKAGIDINAKAEPHPAGMGQNPGQTGNKCPHCGTDNPFGQKFCGNCGASLKKKCPSCGREYDPSQKFCGDCGTRL